MEARVAMVGPQVAMVEAQVAVVGPQVATVGAPFVWAQIAAEQVALVRAPVVEALAVETLGVQAPVVEAMAVETLGVQAPVVVVQIQVAGVQVFEMLVDVVEEQMRLQQEELACLCRNKKQDVKKKEQQQKSASCAYRFVTLVSLALALSLRRLTVAAIPEKLNTLAEFFAGHEIYFPTAVAAF